MDQNRTDKAQVSIGSLYQWSHMQKYHGTRLIWLGHAQNLGMGKWHVTLELIPSHKKIQVLSGNAIFWNISIHICN
jgi:hypothetical protein